MDVPRLDHVALRVRDRTSTTQELLDGFDLRVIEQTERFTLLGAHPEHGKVTLLDPADDREPVPRRIVSLVLASGGAPGAAPVVLRDGLVLTFVEVAGVPRHALVGVSLRATDPPIVAARFDAEHDMAIGSVTPDSAVVEVGGPTGGRITLSRERWSYDDGTAPMLDHVGIRVADAEAVRRRSASRDVDELDWVEAPHSRALFVAGPDELVLEYVELTRAFEGV